MNLKPVELYALSPYEFNLMQQGFELKKKEKISHTRQICWTVLQGYADPKKAPKSIEDYWPLYGEPKKSRRVNKAKINKTLAYLKTLHK